jgi:periplasmic protein TonB
MFDEFWNFGGRAGSNFTRRLTIRRRPSVLLISIAIHTIVLVLLATAPWWSPMTSWPMPRDVMAFSEIPRLANLQDIELPPARIRTTASPASTDAVAELAPVVPSTGIAPETERQGGIGRPGVPFVETTGVGVIEGIGAPIAPPPPPQPRAQEPVRPGGFIRPPTKVVHVAPEYPQIARASRVQGVVIVEATIDSRGNVESAVVLRSIPLLDQAALDAVRQWKFTPTLLNGTAVPVIMTVTVNFTLSQ